MSTIPKLLLSLLTSVFALSSTPNTDGQSVILNAALSHPARWEGGPLELRRRQILGQLPQSNLELEKAIGQWYALSTVEYLRVAEVDSAWLTWSVGLSVEEEEQADKTVVAYMVECHRAGFGVWAEISASQLLLSDREAAAATEVLRDASGKLMLCDGSSGAETSSTRCYQADLRNGQWKTHVVQRALAAIRAGADGIVLNGLSDLHYEAQLVVSFAHEMETELIKSIRSDSGQNATHIGETSTSKPLMIPVLSRSFVGQRLEAPWLAQQDAVWPGVRSSYAALLNGEIMVAGASQSPWIDSNLWLLRCCSALSPSQPVLLSHQNRYGTSRQQAARLKGSLLLAVAEAAALRSSFLLDLEDSIRQGLIEKDPKILEEWESAARYRRFFESHPEMRSMKPLYDAAVVSESCEDSVETLNLLSRRGLFVDVIRPSELSKTSLDAYALAILDPHSRLLDYAFQKVEGFVNAGGVVVTTAANSPANSRFRNLERMQESPESIHYRGGRGRWVVYRDEFPDAGALAAEVKALLAPNSRIVRLWNAPTVLAHPTQLANSNQLALHLLNYGIEPLEELQVQVKGSFRKGAMLAPDLLNPIPLRLERKQGATEFTIPSLEVYGVVILE